MACFFLFLSINARAEPVLPPINRPDTMPEPTLKQRPVSGLKMGSMNITLEETTLSQIMNAMGAGSIAIQEHAGDMNYFLCYTLLKKSSAQRIWLVSHGEMVGRNHALTEIQAIAGSDLHSSKECPSPRHKIAGVHLDHGLWLNSTQQNVKESFGAPSLQNGDWWYYSYSGKESGSEKGTAVDFDVSSLLEVKFVAGTVAAITAAQVTSY